MNTHVEIVPPRGFQMKGVLSTLFGATGVGNRKLVQMRRVMSHEDPEI